MNGLLYAMYQLRKTQVTQVFLVMLSIFCFKGSDGLLSRENRPPQIEITVIKEPSLEISKKDILCLTNWADQSRMDDLLVNHKYWKEFRITIFVQRFITNCWKGHKFQGPLGTEKNWKSWSPLYKFFTTKLITGS